MAERGWMKGIREAAKKRAGDVTAGLASRALDAMQKVDDVRNAPAKLTAAAKTRLGNVAGKAGNVAGRALDVAERVPVAGKVAGKARKAAGTARRAVQARLRRGGKASEVEQVETKPPARAAKKPAPRAMPRPEEKAHLPEPTDPELRLDEGTARVTTTSRGRKTVPLAVAAARKARAKQQGQGGFKPKKGQKKKKTRH